MPEGIWKHSGDLADVTVSLGNEQNSELNFFNSQACGGANVVDSKDAH